jgi:hypothetical protein|tara:strand:+ start:190 stop:426 length:237 start_codon:yes stop_codon:yes gene_type:complete
MKQYIDATPEQVNSAREYLDSRPASLGKVNVMELVTEAGVTNTLDAKEMVLDWFNDQLFDVVVPSYERIKEIVKTEDQ